MEETIGERGHRWVDIKMVLVEVTCAKVGWINLIQDHVMWHTFVDAVINHELKKSAS
jgi:hypothetical protein